MAFRRNSFLSTVAECLCKETFVLKKGLNFVKTYWALLWHSLIIDSVSGAQREAAKVHHLHVRFFAMPDPHLFTVVDSTLLHPQLWLLNSQTQLVQVCLDLLVVLHILLGHEELDLKNKQNESHTWILNNNSVWKIISAKKSVYNFRKSVFKIVFHFSWTFHNSICWLFIEPSWFKLHPPGLKTPLPWNCLKPQAHSDGVSAVSVPVWRPAAPQLSDWNVWRWAAVIQKPVVGNLAWWDGREPSKMSGHPHRPAPRHLIRCWKGSSAMVWIF